MQGHVAFSCDTPTMSPEHWVSGRRPETLKQSSSKQLVKARLRPLPVFLVPPRLEQVGELCTSGTADIHVALADFRERWKSKPLNSTVRLSHHGESEGTDGQEEEDVDETYMMMSLKTTAIVAVATITITMITMMIMRIPTSSFTVVSDCLLALGF